MIRPRSASVLLGVLAAQGCVMDRDNIHDPANVPRVRAVLIDTTLVDGRCSTDFTQEWPVVSVAGRGRCLAIDARETSEPQGERPEDLDYGVAVRADGDLVPVAVEASGAILVFAEGALRALDIDIGLELVLTAKDDSGASGSAELDLILLNSRPVAVAPPPRVSRLGGWPWTPAGGDSFLFDASESADADGDPLQYCWTFDGGPQICHDDPAHADFLRQVPVDAPGTFVGRLVVVDDTGARSPSAWAEVRVEPEVRWMGSYSQDVVIHDDWRSVVSAASGFAIGRVDDGSRDLMFLDDAGSVRLLPLPSLDPVPAGASLADVRTLSSDGKGGFWTLEKPPGPGGDLLYSWSVSSHLVTSVADPGGFVTVRATTPLGSADDACSEGPTPVFTADSAGNAWVASLTTQDLRRIRSTGPVEVVIAGPPPQAGDASCWSVPGTTRRNTAIAGRPGSAEVWLAVAPLETTLDDPMRLEVFDGSGTTPAYSVPVPSVVRQLSWASPDELWVVLPFDGVVLLDASMLAQGASFAEATLRHEPHLVGNVSFHADSRTGGAWAVGGNEGVERLEADGTSRELASGDIQPYFVDRDGALWITDLTGGFYRTRSLAADQLAGNHVLPIPSSFEVAQDPSTGWLWVPLSLGPLLGFPPWELAAISPSGAIARRSQFQDLDPGPGQSLESLPPIGSVRVTADGKSLYYLTGYNDSVTPEELFRLDLSTDPPTVAAHSADPVLVDAVRSISKFVPSAPGVPPFLWYFDDGTMSVKTVDESLDVSTITTAFALPADEQGMYPDGMVMPGSNRFCMVTRDGAASSYRIRYVSRDGSTNGSLFSQPAVGASSLAFAATWVGATAESEVCWAMFLADGIFPDHSVVMRSMDGAGALVATKTYSGTAFEYPLSLMPISGSESWGVMIGSSVPALRLLRIGPGAVDPPDVPITGGGAYRGAFSSH